MMHILRYCYFAGTIGNNSAMSATCIVMSPEEVNMVMPPQGLNVWNVITTDNYSFFFFLVLQAFYFQFSLRPAQVLVLWMLSKCKVQK